MRGASCDGIPLFESYVKVITGDKKMPKMGQNSKIRPFFARRAKKASAEGLSPPQELEVSPRSGLYLLVILNNGILKSNTAIFPRSEGYISQDTPYGVYRQIFNKNNQVNISLLIVKMTKCPY